MKVVVIDPRRTDTCELADLHLAILPGTDVALFHGILHLLLWEDWIDRDFIQAHTDGLAELKRLVHDYTPQMVTQLCGISVE
ncbi:molybdopterin-dependent oxidoreductase, partial [Acinetobacter baumannii]|nr:molybdopterin-dependent oxidoreductase [Acinetobacter baumannii]